MPPRTLLSSEQRIRLFSIPTDPTEMTRHYVLDANDLALVGARRRGGMGVEYLYCGMAGEPLSGCATAAIAAPDTSAITAADLATELGAFMLFSPEIHR